MTLVDEAQSVERPAQKGLVASARAHGLKAAAREFGCSRNTVRKWLRRYQPGKPSALRERSRRLKRSPNQIPKGLEGQIVKRRHQTSFGPNASSGNFGCLAAPTPSPASSASTNWCNPGKRNPPPNSSSARLNATGNSLGIRELVFVSFINGISVACSEHSTSHGV
ncbi:MAG: helix-turn-helix domain-containing protein [Verrucomicrobia bacterium]|nr:helix-turn-helix domain-containing protein [Verrucomicrobiota bacterium]